MPILYVLIPLIRALERPKMNKNVSHVKLFSIIVMTMIVVSSDVHAQTLGDMLDNISAQTNLIQLIAFMAYIIGFIFTAVGIYKLRQHVEFGPQKIELPEPLKYLFTAGLMFALPSVYNVAVNTFNSEGDAQLVSNLVFEDTSSDGSTLDGMMQAFVQDAYGPMLTLLQFFCFLAGAILLIIAVHRFTKTEREGPRGPTGLGTVSTFVLAGVFFAIAPMVGVFTETFFGDRVSRTVVTFMAIDSDATGYANANNVLTAVLAFLIIVGVLSIIRGFFVLRGVAEGTQQMTMMSGVSHVIAGAILVNFGEFANIIQNTLGVGDFGVLFN